MDDTLIWGARVMIIGIPSTALVNWDLQQEEVAYPIGGVIARPLSSLRERLP
jgi:hypothetical protein